MAQQAQKPQIIRPTPGRQIELAPREKIMGSGLSDDEAFGDGGDETPKGAAPGPKAPLVTKIEPGGVVERVLGGSGADDAREASEVGGAAGADPSGSSEIEPDEVDEAEAAEIEVEAERDYVRGGEVIKVNDDGTLALPIAEKLALAMADGFPKNQAWKIAGGKAAPYRKRILANPVFRMRLQLLQMERDKLLETEREEDDVFWMVKQNWRIARAGGVVSEIHRATVLLTETIAKRNGQVAPEEGAAAPAGDAKAPGRPAHQPRALRADATQMAGALRGLARPQKPVEPAL